MPYIDLAGLSRYASRQKERLERDCALLRDMQWTQSEKAGAVSLWPAGGTPLKPSVDFLFSETPPAEGDKGPENPSTITGVSSVKVTRCGKNLISTPYNYGPSFTQHGYTITENQDGSLTLNGSSDGQGACHFNLTSNYSFKLHAGISYAASITNINNSEVILQGFNSAGSIKFTAYADGTPRIFTLNNDEYVTIRMSVTKLAGTLANAVVRPQLELGTDATDFEHYAGTDYTLPLGGTFYGGTLDAASGVMTVTHAKNIVNGDTIYSTSLGLSENVTSYALSFYPSPGRQKSQTTADRACDLLPIGGSDSNRVLFGNNSSNIQIWLSKSLLNLSDGLSFSDVKPAFSAFFAEHPMNIVYKMETPQTVQLSPVSISALAQSDKYTPRLNTVYTDAQAVQVGYVKSPIRDEYELQQAVIAQGGNV